MAGRKLNGNAAFFIFAAAFIADFLLFQGRSAATELQSQKSQTTETPSECTKLTVGGADGWEPITYISEEGRHLGLGIDIIQEYARKHGLRVELKLNLTWTRSLDLLEVGDLDVIAGAYFTKERNETFKYSVPFTDDDIVVFQHKDNRFDVTSIHDLVGLRGARPQGGSYGDYVDTYAQNNLDMIFSPTGNRIFYTLINDRVDYVMLGLYDGLANIYRDQHENIIIPIEPPLLRNEVHLMFSRKSPCVEHVANIDLLVSELSENGKLDRWTTAHLRNAIPEPETNR
ncbi:MAG: transporter substrate-binding domain-containing protein [Rhodospirillales bacterium]|nr:transporter substrate-binding domain-containing protein [Rhodospirillales bacterium]